MRGSKYATNQFGYTPKSDTFKHLTVTESFKEKKRKQVSLVEFSNFDTGGQNFQIPDTVENICFRIESNGRDVFSGPYVILLPEAIAGKKIKFFFETSSIHPLNVVEDPILPLPPFHFTDDLGKVYEQSWDNMMLDDMQISLKCKNSDGFRGCSINPTTSKKTEIKEITHIAGEATVVVPGYIKFEKLKVNISGASEDVYNGEYDIFDIKYTNTNETQFKYLITAAVTNNLMTTDLILTFEPPAVISNLPFDRDSSMDIVTHRDAQFDPGRFAKLTMPDLLHSYAELECLRDGLWTGVFYGAWEN
tara:strand:+ start:6249 stop:7163 length:915 start_codon:yes stop_codon:yes gene_type:complete